MSVPSQIIPPQLFKKPWKWKFIILSALISVYSSFQSMSRHLYIVHPSRPFQEIIRAQGIKCGKQHSVRQCIKILVVGSYSDKPLIPHPPFQRQTRPSLIPLFLYAPVREHHLFVFTLYPVALLFQSARWIYQSHNPPLASFKSILILPPAVRPLVLWTRFPSFRSTFDSKSILLQNLSSSFPNTSRSSLPILSSLSYPTIQRALSPISSSIRRTTLSYNYTGYV